MRRLLTYRLVCAGGGGALCGRFSCAIAIVLCKEDDGDTVGSGGSRQCIKTGQDCEGDGGSFTCRLCRLPNLTHAILTDFLRNFARAASPQCAGYAPGSSFADCLLCSACSAVSAGASAAASAAAWHRQPCCSVGCHCCSCRNRLPARKAEGANEPEAPCTTDVIATALADVPETSTDTLTSLQNSCLRKPVGTNAAKQA